eukprot:COSAG06_NODE_12075_length_1426_cov_2.969857_3_plen_71_part_01
MEAAYLGDLEDDQGNGRRLQGMGAPGAPPQCADVDPVCVESDVAALMGGNFEGATQGCQCCFMTADPDAGD